jgi:hypothetical protein
MTGGNVELDCRISKKIETEYKTRYIFYGLTGEVQTPTVLVFYFKL